MTARSAFTAVRGKLEVDGIHPRAEWDEIFHSLGFGPGMNFMARPAGPASFRFINVDVMQVLVAVTKVGQSRCAFIQNKRTFMAHEAQIVHFDRKWAVERTRKRIRQNPEMLRAVRLMAQRATALTNGTVQHRIVFDPGLHVDYWSIRCFHGFIMTA